MVSICLKDKINWKNFYDKESEFKRFIPQEDPSEEKRVQLVFSLLPRKKIGSILDVGCGDGYLCNTFLQKGIAKTVVGEDLSLNRLHFAKKKFKGCKFVVAEITNLPFKSNFFDIVSAVEVLEHLDVPLKALYELRRVSSRYVLFATPYKETLQQTLCPHCLKMFYKDGHIQSFDEEKVKKLCQICSLKIVKMKIYVSSRAFDLDGALSWIPDKTKEFIKNIFFKARLVSGAAIGVLALKGQ
ncbi:MAG: class I SAM-dependent methyltransferase [bacterium]|nr:class I SAM-dependent methyltransferase [bacterium]